MLKVLSVLGTRPEAIKMAPVICELRRRTGAVISRVCATAQHRQMLDQVLSLFHIVPDYDLNLMQGAQSPTQVAAAVLAQLDPVLRAERPDWVLVQGDTTTVMAAAITAFYAGIKIGHVEAGLRTWDKNQPFPEEGNRRIVGAIADLHFAPTDHAASNLLAENIKSDRITVTGNPGIDALYAVRSISFDSSSSLIATVPARKRVVLVTVHRREHFGEPLEQICRALKTIAAHWYHDTEIVYPVHANPQVREPVYRLLSGIPGITLLPPLNYLELVKLLERSYFVMTDSGGLQEEGPCLGKPVLVLRNTTERPEGITAGVAKMVGLSHQRIVDEACRLIAEETSYQAMSRVVHCYGDGNAAKRIVHYLIKEEGRSYEERWDDLPQSVSPPLL